MDRLLFIFLQKFIRRGSLKVTTANGTTRTFGDGSGPGVVVRFTSAAAQRAVLFDPELKLGEAYMDGTFVVERGSIADVLAVLLRQERIGAANWAWLPRLFRHLFRRLQQYNPRSRSRQNVAHHYDLDGRLYSLFLDCDRQYSCAYFETRDQALDDAQLAKRRHLAAKLRPMAAREISMWIRSSGTRQPKLPVGISPKLTPMASRQSQWANAFSAAGTAARLNPMPACSG